MQPIDTVNDIGFQSMIKKFEPCYTIPDRKTFSVTYLPQMYDTKKKRISNLNFSASLYSCTTDIWMSRAQHAYISLTIHYLAGDFTLHSRLLESNEFPDSHSGVNIAQELTQNLKECGLTMDKLVSFTTNNARKNWNAYECHVSAIV
uniref:DUF659 domain-containing protein n=1 Tax=Amphimedon queenslandica TaxID=400682 RepID=A0A1X7VR53_AMPQE